MKLAVVLLSIGFGLTTLTAYAKIKRIPNGFRDWTHTKSMVIPDKSHGLYGFHNIYANKRALNTLKEGGKKFPIGSGFVVSFYDVVNKDGTVNQGKKIMDAVMIKDKTSKSTDYWAYAAFDAKGKMKAINPAKDCHECHKKQKDRDYVFHNYIK